MRSVMILPLLGLVACTWVSDDDVKARLPEVDDDQDGVVAADDCDDNNPEIYPGAAEIWYDDIDENCDGLDDNDQDGDGILQIDDCDDTAAETFPGAPDVPYDGVDSDCAGDDDYDVDGDSFVQAGDEGLPTTGVDGSGLLPGGDCDDDNATVNPDQVDLAYDGVDTDCSGEDDFDQDQDGYVADEHVGEPTTYVDGSGALPGGDCDDAEDTTYADAPDPAYDGVDSDCAEDDDYDVDADGYVPDEYVGLVTGDIEGTGELPGGDCDDDDADVNPGSVETLGDGLDQDCDGGDSSFPLTAPKLDYSLVFTGPQRIRMKANSTLLVLSVAADQVDVTSTTTTTSYYDGAVAMSWALDALHDGSSGEFKPWSTGFDDSEIYHLTGGHDIVVNDYGMFGAVGFLRPEKSRTLRVGSWDFDDSTPGRSYTLSDDLGELSDIAVALDSAGDLHVFGCDDEAVAQYVQVDLSEMYSTGAFPTEISVTLYAQINEFAASSCAMSYDDAPGTVYASQDDGFTQSSLSIEETNIFTYGDPEFLQSDLLDTYLPEGIELVTNPDGERYRVFYDAVTEEILALDEDDNEIVIDAFVTASTPVRAAFSPDGRLFVAYVDDSEATVSYGLIEDGAFSAATTTLVTSFTPIEVGVWAGDDGSGGTDLAVSVLGETEIAMGTALVAP